MTINSFILLKSHSDTCRARKRQWHSGKTRFPRSSSGSVMKRTPGDTYRSNTQDYHSWTKKHQQCRFMLYFFNRPLLVSWLKRWRWWRSLVVWQGTRHQRRTGRTGVVKSWTKWRCLSCKTTCSRRSRQNKMSVKSLARSGRSWRRQESELSVKFNPIIASVFIGIVIST